MPNSLNSLLASSFDAADCGFSIGGLGALAEFHDAAAERADAGSALQLRCPRGALKIHAAADPIALAYETLSTNRRSWQHGIVVHGSRQRCTMATRSVLTEVGRDAGSLCPASREDLLFDIGVGLPNVDFCVRSADPALLRTLRRHCGETIARAGHPALEAIIDAGPHRVVASALARIEVYQAIDRHQTPAGPHTHLLPDLLRARRMSDGNIPLPDGALPLLTIHPAHPLLDAFGHPRTFSRERHDAFQVLLDEFGHPDYVAAKHALGDAVARGDDPAAHEPARTRIGRLAQRVVLRQLAYLHREPACLVQWLERFGV